MTTYKLPDENFPELFWEEYLNLDFNILRQDKLEKIRKYLNRYKQFQGFTGEEYQEEHLKEKIEEITGLTFSWRSWGALMAAYMNSKAGIRKFSYIDYYMYL